MDTVQVIAAPRKSAWAMLPSRGVLLDPLARGLVMLGPVFLVDLRDLRHEGVVWIRVCEEGRDGEQHLRNREGRTPLVLQDVQADRSIRVDVAMVDLRGEMALRRLERVICWKADVQEEDSASVRRVRRSHDSRLPIEHV